MNAAMFDFLNTDPFLLFFGSFYMVLGLSAFLAKDAWIGVIELFQESRPLNLMMGVMVLPISLFIIVFYNNWDSIASIILMVVGYLALAKAVTLLLYPQLIQNFLKMEFVQKWLWLDGLSGLALGLALLVL